MTLTDALQVLNAAQHRGCRAWHYDASCRRVLPEGWSGLNDAAAPCFTLWEALTIARGLVGIGAARLEYAPTWHVRALP